MLIGAYFVYATVSSVNLISPANATWNLTGNMTFTCNATASGATIQNVTLYIWNSTGVYTTQTNTTAGTADGTVIRTFTITNIPEESGLNYTWNCLAYDNTSASSWASANYTFGVDLNAPNVSLVSPSNRSTDDDGTVTFKYTVVDTATTVPNCTLYLAGTATQTDTSITESTNQTFTVTNPTQSDNLAWFVSCYDSNGRQGNSTTYYLDTYNNPSPGGSSRNKYEHGELTRTKTQYKLNYKDYIKFQYKGEDHRLTLTKKRTDYMEVEISSDPITVRVNSGETENVDIDGDSTYDLSVSYEGLDGSKAIVSIAEYVAPVTTTTCTESWECTEWSECIDGKMTRTCTDTNSCGTETDKPAETQVCTEESQPQETLDETPKTAQEKSNNSWIAWTIVLIVVLGGTWYFFFRKNK